MRAAAENAWGHETLEEAGGISSWRLCRERRPAHTFPPDSWRPELWGKKCSLWQPQDTTGAPPVGEVIRATPGHLGSRNFPNHEAEGCSVESECKGLPELSEIKTEAQRGVSSAQGPSL